MSQSPSAQSQLRLSTEVLEDVISHREVELPQECPECGHISKLELSEIPNSICRDCGYVIGCGVDTPGLENENNDNDSVDTQSWSEFYSITNSTEKQVATAFEEIEAVSDELFLSTGCREQIAEVYAAASAENVTDGRPTSLVVAAAICIGSREIEEPRPSERVASAMELKTSRLKQTIRRFQEELDRGYSDLSAAAYVAYLCNDAGLKSEVETRATQLIEAFETQDEPRYSSMHPAGIAGAAIYVSARDEVTQRDVATIAGVSKETIRVRVNDLKGASYNEPDASE